MKPRHGLVIGKFYPPHAGHALLIRAAAETAERVTVVVMASRVESIPLAFRVSWLREIHAAETNVTVTGIADEHPIDLESDAVWHAHVALMRAAAATVTDQPIDTVFTSERYGDELGRRLGARHRAIDPGRERVPVSGSAVRADPIAHWDALAACVREHLAWRVVLVGAESTGKTTLAAELAARLAARGGAWAGTEWVPEIGRDATIAKLAAQGAESGDVAAMASLVWTTADFVAIARAQAERERAAARRGGPVLICDTDAFATGVWHERYLGSRSPATEALGEAAPRHLYLVTHDADVPFVQDGLRDGEHLRRWMTRRFAERLDATARSWRWLRGTGPERVTAALAAIDQALAGGWRLAAPLG